MKTEKFEIEIRLDTVGKFLQKHRAKVGLTQRDIAKKLKYSSPQFVSNWERGLALPPIDQLPHISRLLNVTGDEIINVLSDYQDRVSQLQRQSLARIFARSKR